LIQIPTKVDIVSVDKRSEFKLKKSTERLEEFVVQYDKSDISADIRSKAEEIEKVNSLFFFPLFTFLILPLNCSCLFQNPVDRHVVNFVRSRSSFFTHIYILSKRMLINLSRSFDAVYNRSTQPVEISSSFKPPFDFSQTCLSFSSSSSSSLSVSFSLFILNSFCSHSSYGSFSFGWKTIKHQSKTEQVFFTNASLHRSSLP